jgi:hypothetical protein
MRQVEVAATSLLVTSESATVFPGGFANRQRTNWVTAYCLYDFQDHHRVVATTVEYISDAAFHLCRQVDEDRSKCLPVGKRLVVDMAQMAFRRAEELLCDILLI